MPSDKKGGTDGFKDRLVSPSSEFGVNTAGCLAFNGGGFGQSSYLSRISRFIFMEKKLSCGEILAFHV